MKKKNFTMVVTCLTIALSLIACGSKNSKKDEEVVQMINPWIECSSIEEAEENAGFLVEVPEAIDGFNSEVVQNMGTEIIEVIYYATDNSDKEIRIRKGTGSEDISGDYNIYSETTQVTIANYDVTLQGDDGKVSLATWTIDGFSYALSVPELTTEEVSAVIQQIN